MSPPHSGCSSGVIYCISIRIIVSKYKNTHFHLLHRSAGFMLTIHQYLLSYYYLLLLTYYYYNFAKTIDFLSFTVLCVWRRNKRLLLLLLLMQWCAGCTTDWMCCPPFPSPVGAARKSGNKQNLTAVSLTRKLLPTS